MSSIRMNRQRHPLIEQHSEWPPTVCMEQERPRAEFLRRVDVQRQGAMADLAMALLAVAFSAAIVIGWIA